MKDRATTQEAVTAIILAGGAGRRMGGQDKGLQDFRGRPLVCTVLDRIRSQVTDVLIVANRNAERYASFGYSVIADQVGGFAGPLAGLHAGLKTTTSDLVASVPCDTPFLPLDLITRLALPLQDPRCELSVARTGHQVHPVFCLARRKLLPHLEAFLGSGGRKFDTWYANLAVVEVAFDDQVDAFRNLNTLD
ncbi:MAG: molybdenum cofactor guanylyltransferase MobA, partial [Burkholderiales bacterium]